MPELTGSSEIDAIPGQLFVRDLSLHQQLASLESVFHAAPVGLCVLDSSFRYVTVNPCFARMYNRDIADFLGRTVEQALPGPARQIMMQLREVVETGAILHREITLCDPRAAEDDGDAPLVTYFRSAQPVYNANGEVAGVSVSVVDITARKQIETALRESEEDLRHTVELTPHLPWTADASGEITFVSPRWQAFTGMKFDQFLLKDWLLALHKEDRRTALLRWQQSVETGDPFDAEYRMRVTNGGYRWVRGRAYPRRADSGHVIRWYGTVEDIHDRKLVEAALQLKTEELARRVREDHLTGLANRRRFDEALDSEVRRARRAQLPLALLMIDVDHFKHFNDTWGHVAGDECLRSIAHALYSVTRRPGDLVARFGGEEFSVILPNTKFEGARDLAGRALAAVAGLNLSTHQVTVSIGLAMLDMAPGDEKFDRALPLVKAADDALYKAKANGRNCVAVNEQD